MADTADESPPDADEVRRRIARQLHVDVRRQREQEATSQESLVLRGRGIGDTMQARGMVLTWSKQAKDALPKRPGTKKAASDTDD